MSPKIIGPFKGKIGHKAQALMVRCMDFRLQEAFNKFMEVRQLADAGCDVIGIAGGVKDWPLVEKHLDLAVNLHQVERVILVNHRHCGAYGKEIQTDPAAEFEKHKEDLLETAQKIKAKYPKLSIETWFAEMTPKGETSEINFIRL